MKQIIIILVAIVFTSVISAQITITSNEKSSLVYNEETDKFDIYQTEVSETFWRIKDDVLLFNGISGTKTFIIMEFRESNEKFNLTLRTVSGESYNLTLDLIQKKMLVMYYVKESLFLDIYPIVSIWE